MSPALEGFWPMDDRPGALASLTRWRKMARLWQFSGVARYPFNAVGEPNPLSVYGHDLANQAVSVAPGACWINGFYGEQWSAIRLDTPGNVGLVFTRLDPVGESIQVFFVPGATPGAGTQDPNGVWDVELGYLPGDGSAQDLRYLVPPDPVPPPVALPDSTPRGLLLSVDGPPGQIDLPNPGAVNSMFSASLAAYPGFMPGRTYRFNAWARYQAINTAGPQVPHDQRISLRVTDDAGERRTQELYRGLSLYQNVAGDVYSCGGFTIAPVYGNAVADIVATSNPNTMRFYPWTLRIEVSDVGVL